MNQPKFNQTNVLFGSSNIRLDPEKVTIPVEKLFNMNQMQQKYSPRGNQKRNKRCLDTFNIATAKVIMQSNNKPIIPNNCEGKNCNTKIEESIVACHIHKSNVKDYHEQKTDKKCKSPNAKVNAMSINSCNAIECDTFKELDTVKLIKDEAIDYYQQETDKKCKSPSKKTNDVFKLLMDNRHKVIGANASGKEKSPTPEDELPTNYKEKLRTHKKNLEALVAAKNKSKQFEQEMRQEQIKNVLNSRAVLMKEMLNIQAKSSQTVNNNCDNKTKTRRGRKSSLSLKKHSSKDLEITVGDMICQQSNQKENKTVAGNVVTVQRRKRRTSAKNCSESVVRTEGQSSEASSPISNVENAKTNSRDDKCVSLQLAPIFSMGSAKKSGILAATKKLLQKQGCVSAISLSEFPSVSHIYQKCKSPLWNLPLTNLKLLSENLIDNDFLTNVMHVNDWNCLTMKTQLKCVPKLGFSKLTENVDEELMQIKTELPDFPVFRCFKLFRERNGFVYLDENATKKFKKRHSDSQSGYQQQRQERYDDVLMWTEKYKPASSRMIIGNQQAVHMLRDWLHAWCEYTIETVNSQTKRKRRDSSDFESDSSCGPELLSNVMILRGPPGCGKTFTINAICKEFDIKVLEINVSSRRTGKKLLQELHEATQSHQVRNKDVSDGENMFKSFLKKTPSTLESRNTMCAIVIDDADIVFDQDEGFVSALNQLILTSKRPIILTATDFHAPYLSKLIVQYPLINFAALSANTLAPYLQVLCLVEGLKVNRQSLGELLEWNNGDARRTLLQLQYWLQSGGDVECGCEGGTCNKLSHLSARRSKIFSDTFEEHHEDYDDCSFLLSGVITKPPPPKTHTNCIQSFIRYDANDQVIPMPLDLAAFWWNMPNLLGFEAMTHKCGTQSHERNALDGSASTQEVMSFSNILKCMDALCICDTLNRLGRHVSTIEPCPKYWDDVVRDGFLLNHPPEDFSYERKFSEDVAYAVLEGSCSAESVSARNWNFANPCSIERIWRRAQFDCMGELESAVGMHKRCDRKAFAIDYVPMMQHIARLEAYRQNNNRKRSKRFCHYFKAMGFEITPSTLKTATTTFQFE